MSAFDSNFRVSRRRVLGVLGGLGIGTAAWQRALAAQVAQQGAVQSFKENRGQFLSYTLGELFDQYPFGAGVGRWGMMNVYFGDPTDLNSPPIYVEIQLTGWLLDGGAPMWLFYGGALLTGIALRNLPAFMSITATALDSWLAVNARCRSPA